MSGKKSTEMQFISILTFKTYMIINLLHLQESEDLYCGTL